MSVSLLSDLESGKERAVSLANALKVARQLGLAIVVVPRAELPSVLTCLEKKP